MPVLAQSDKWFPAVESTSVVGRFIDVEEVDPIASTKAGKIVNRYRPVLQAKVAGSSEMSPQPVKPFNKEELMQRFPGAWEHYEKLKEAMEAAGPELTYDPELRGTPVEAGDLYNHARIAWFKSTGIYTHEQVADMSDTIVENAGRSGGMGMRAARKKSREYLAAQKANTR